MSGRGPILPEDFKHTLEDLSVARKSFDKSRKSAGLPISNELFYQSNSYREIIQASRNAQANVENRKIKTPEGIHESNSKVIDARKLDNLFASVGWEPRGTNKWHEIITKSSAVISIYDNAKMIGFGRLVEDGSVASLHDGVVHPDYQQQGLFSRIHNYGLTQIAGKDYDRIMLVAEPGTEDMYKHLGYLPATDVMVFGLDTAPRAEVSTAPHAPTTTESLINRSTLELANMLGNIAAELARRQES
jgi:ribosomal protein S18 acetylase RimI-like enzyme